MFVIPRKSFKVWIIAVAVGLPLILSFPFGILTSVDPKTRWEVSAIESAPQVVATQTRLDYDPIDHYLSETTIFSRSKCDWTDSDPKDDSDPDQFSQYLFDDAEANRIDPIIPAVTEPVAEVLVFTEVDYALYVKARSLNLRSEPTTDSEILYKLGSGTKVACEGENEQWMKVRYNGELGYLKTEYTSKTMYFRPVKETVYVKSSNLNLRSGPSTDDEVLDKLHKNTALTRTGIGDEWSKVVTSNGLTGYVYSSYITKLPNITLNASFRSEHDYSGLSQEEIDLLTKIVALEGSPKYGYDGYLAVTSVILNRVENPRFANTIFGVVSAPGQFSVYTTSRTPYYNDHVRQAVSDALAGIRNLPSYVMYFITCAAYETNVAGGGSFSHLEAYGVTCGTVWCYRASDR